MWRKLAAQQRRHLWRLYGIFTSFIFVGCASGILASSFNIPFQQSAVDYSLQLNKLANDSNYDDQELYFKDVSNLFAIGADNADNFMRWVIPDGIHLYAMNWAKLIVLERITRVSVSSASGMPRRWVLAERFAVVVIFVMNLISLCCKFALLSYLPRLVSLLRNAAVTFLVDPADEEAPLILEQADDVNNSIYKISSVLQACDAAAQLFIVATFLLVAGFCAGRIKRILRRQELAAQGSVEADALVDDMRTVMWQVLITCLVIFLSLASIAALLTLNAVVNADGVGKEECPEGQLSNVCDSCHNQNHLIRQWINFHPELPVMVYDVSSCISLLVALWGMTSKRLLHAFKLPRPRHVEENHMQTQ